MKTYYLTHDAPAPMHDSARDLIAPENRRIAESGDSADRDVVERDYLAQLPADLVRDYRISIVAEDVEI